MSLIFVDCEARGPCPSMGYLTEFGAVWFEGDRPPSEWATFHGVCDCEKRPALPWGMGPDPRHWSFVCAPGHEMRDLWKTFACWLTLTDGRPIMVSDNPAFDAQWIADGFWRHLGRNPFGHSARRMSDFYAGLVGDFRRTQEWKRLRRTPHTHHPVQDAMGNAEAFARILKGER